MRLWIIGKPTNATNLAGAPVSAPTPRETAFTLIELMVLLTVVFLLACVIKPAIAGTKTTGLSFRCQNQHRQLTTAWRMYAADNNDRVVDQGSAEEVPGPMIAPWVRNVMTWGVSNPISDRSNTNLNWLTNTLIAKYLVTSADSYKCPGDKYLSPIQVRAGWKYRVRSFSMNWLIGLAKPAQSNGFNSSGYAQYLKESQIQKPAKTWLLVDEHPDSINDGSFANNPTGTQWQDIPASHHTGGCTFSFIDGHAELRRWRSATSIYPVIYGYPVTRHFDPSGREDFKWYLERSGYVQNGVPQFGY